MLKNLSQQAPCICLLLHLSIMFWRGLKLQGLKQGIYYMISLKTELYLLMFTCTGKFIRMAFVMFIIMLYYSCLHRCL